MESNQLILGKNEVGLGWKKFTDLVWVKAVIIVRTRIHVIPVLTCFDFIYYRDGNWRIEHYIVGHKIFYKVPTY